jgi:CHASE3 domain sensor protein
MQNNNYVDTRLANTIAKITADLANELNKITADAAKQIQADMTALEAARKRRNMLIGSSILVGIVAVGIAAVLI